MVPGSKEPVYTPEEGLKMAENIGFPVMIKASSGGGGKGMRISRSAEDFEGNFNQAQMESVKAFLTIPCTSRSTSSSQGILNSRFWRTSTAM